MNKVIGKAPYLFLFLSIVGCHSLHQRVAPEVLLLRDGESAYFARGGRHMSYIELRSDGTYVGHAGSSTISTMVYDEGTWEQDKSGVITIKGKVLCADVLEPPLRVWVITHENRKKMPAVDKAIESFLAKHSEDIFAVETYWGKFPEHGLFGEVPPRSQLDVKVGEKPIKMISRKQLRDLLEAISRYRKNPQVHHRKAKLLKYKGTVFLLALNYGMTRDWDLNHILRVLDMADEPDCAIQMNEAEFKEATAVSERSPWLDKIGKEVEQSRPADAGQ